MASRSVRIIFTNTAGDSKSLSFKQLLADIPMDTSGTPIDTTPVGSGGSSSPNGTGPANDTVVSIGGDLANLDFSDLDFSDLDLDFSNINFGLGALGEMSIGPIFAPGGGTTIQGWNNGNPTNNWGMGAGANLFANGNLNVTQLANTTANSLNTSQDINQNIPLSGGSGFVTQTNSPQSNTASTGSPKGITI